jgi:hypothetical protein
VPPAPPPGSDPAARLDALSKAIEKYSKTFGPDDPRRKGHPEGRGGQPSVQGFGTQAANVVGREWEQSKAHARDIEGIFGRIASFAKGMVKDPHGTFKKSGRSVGRFTDEMMKNPVASFVMAGKVVGQMAGAVVKAYKALERWTDTALNKAAALAEVSGGMATVTAMREMHARERGRTLGEKTSATASKLEASEDARKRQEGKIEALMDNLKNSLTTVGNNIAEKLMKPIGTLAEKIDKSIFGGEGPKGGIDGVMPSVMAAQKIDEERTQSMMDAARSAAARYRGGSAAPSGASALGSGPSPRPLP